MKINFPLDVRGMGKVFRYQPRPPGNAPPPVPDGAFSLNSPSILQSCGKSSCRHCESFRSWSCPFVTSPRLKRQFWLNETLFPAKQSDEANNSTQKAIPICLIVLIRVFDP